MSSSILNSLTVLNDRPAALTTKTPPPTAENFVGNVALVTLGCAKNLVDSEVMLGALKQRGYQPVADPTNAELIVVNTCAFLESAVTEGIDTILDLAKLKETGRCRQLFVAGCMVERYRSDLEKSLPEVDRFISTDELLSVANLDQTTEECFDQARRPYFLYDETMPRVRSTADHTTYVKVAEGCDRPCSFCIIPKIRGTFRSRPISSIVNEIDQLLIQGVKEYNLVAQDLTAYGKDLEKTAAHSSLLPTLLKDISSLRDKHNDFWVRLLYAYPIGVNEELIRQIIDSPVVCNYLDLPLQHIAKPVLKAMRRPLGEKGTRGLIEQVKHIAPELALRTTFIVGFPGETDEDFQSLVNFVNDGYFTHVGVFTYSQESESDAFHLPNQVEEAVKQERKNYLMECQQQIVERRMNELVGRQIKVLVEGPHQESDFLLVGRCEWQAPETDGEVIINELEDESVLESSPEEMKSLFGTFQTVEVTEVAGYDLVGKLINS